MTFLTVSKSAFKIFLSALLFLGSIPIVMPAEARSRRVKSAPPPLRLPSRDLDFGALRKHPQNKISMPAFIVMTPVSPVARTGVGAWTDPGKVPSESGGRLSSVRPYTPDDFQQSIDAYSLRACFQRNAGKPVSSCLSARTGAAAPKTSDLAAAMSEDVRIPRMPDEQRRLGEKLGFRFSNDPL